MTGRRICAGYYRRYDRRVVYVVSLATDADTGEETAVWTAYPFVDVPKYYTSSKKSFCKKYADVFTILRSYPELENYLSPFVDAWESRTEFIGESLENGIILTCMLVGFVALP